MPMDNEYFQDWLAVIDNLGDAQRAEAEAVLLGRCEAVSSLAAVELAVDDDRCCPHCSTPGAVSRGKARGLRRYQCKNCRRTFNAATGTRLSGLPYKRSLADLWRMPGCGRNGSGVSGALQPCRQHGLSLATPVFAGHKAGPAKTQRDSRGR